MGRILQHPPLSLNGKVSFLVAKNLHVKIRGGMWMLTLRSDGFCCPKGAGKSENSNTGWVGGTKTYLNSEFDYTPEI